MKTLFLLLALAIVPASAQSAKVVQLSPDDVTEARSLWAQKVYVEARIAALKQRIAKDNGIGEIEFSTDFRFAVPKSPYSLSSGNMWSCTTYSLTTNVWNSCFPGFDSSIQNEGDEIYYKGSVTSY